MVRILLVGCALIVCLTGCDCGLKVEIDSKPNDVRGQKTVEAEQWQVVDVGEFTISLPSGWKHEGGKGMDSKCGDFEGGGISLSYDLGMYSNELRIEGATVEETKIDGKEARIVVGGKEKMAGVYIPEAAKPLDEEGKPFGKYWYSLCVYGKSLTEDQQKMAVQIFRTIKFKE